MKSTIISIIGPESSGKSSLSQKLATYFNTDYLAEYARAYLEAKESSDYSLKDVLIMQENQIKGEDNFLSQKKAIYILDTDVSTYKIWLFLKYGMSSAVTESRLKNQTKRDYLLCYPDLDWQEDPLRESRAKNERQYHFECYRNYLESNNQNFAIITGKGDNRLHAALSFINA